MTASETPVPAGRSADRDAAWQQVRRNLKVAPGPRVFDQWLAPAVLVEGSEDDLVRIGLPSAFMTNYVRSHFADRLLHEFRALLPGVRRVTVETLDSSDDRARRSVDTAGVRDRAAPITAALTSAIPAATGQRLRERHAFDPRLGFDRFVVDDSNRVAFNAARKLAEAGRPQFSPLYLHSPTGLGKTHLMHAIGQAFLATSPDASAIYMPAERFMFEFVQAMRARDTHAFKARLRSVDLLMIDDLQFIAGKDSTQEECFHTVNEFMTMGKRLVIACDRAPQALEGVESRLVSRLGAGLVADIRAPELSLRRAILAERLAAMPDVTVPEDVVDLLAARIASSIRELEGALNRLVAYAQLIGSAVTMDFAVATLGDMLRGAQRRITIDEIQKAVSAHFEVKQLDLLSDRRAVAIARPRQIAMYLAKRLTTRSLPEIGRKFGNRDHSTVIHAVKRIEDLRSRDHEIDGAVRTLMMQLEG